MGTRIETPDGRLCPGRIATDRLTRATLLTHATPIAAAVPGTTAQWVTTRSPPPSRASPRPPCC